MYKCLNCKKLFKSSKTLIHYDYKGWVCIKCSKTFKGYTEEELKVLQDKLYNQVDKFKRQYDMKEDTILLLQQFIKEYKDNNYRVKTWRD